MPVAYCRFRKFCWKQWTFKIEIRYFQVLWKQWTFKIEILLDEIFICHQQKISLGYYDL
jgi:hypothetical protein